MSRIGAGDALIGLALVVLVLAALLPSYRARAFERMIEDAVADVESLTVGAARARDLNGSWPSAAPPGISPAEISGTFPGDSALARAAYTLEWRLWLRVEEAPAPPRAAVSPALDDDEQPPPPGARAADTPPDSAVVETVDVVHTEGAVVVHSGRRVLLAELLRHYGEDISFVRDTTWTLLVFRDPAD